MNIPPDNSANTAWHCATVTRQRHEQSVQQVIALLRDRNILSLPE